MQAIFVIGFISIFCLDKTLGKNKCYLSKICIHTNNEKCGKNRNGEVRRFLDSCDMKEFNCLKNTHYIPTDAKECKDLPKQDETILERDIGESEELEFDEYNDNIKNYETEPSEKQSEPDEEEVNAYIDVKKSTELPTEMLDENINEREQFEESANNDYRPEEKGDDVVKEFDPKYPIKEFKKMTHRLKKATNDKSKLYSDEDSEEVNESIEYVSKSGEDVSQSGEDRSEVSSAMSESNGKDMSGEDVTLSSEDVGYEDYFLNSSFFGAS